MLCIIDNIILFITFLSPLIGICISFVPHGEIRVLHIKSIAVAINAVKILLLTALLVNVSKRLPSRSCVIADKSWLVTNLACIELTCR